MKNPNELFGQPNIPVVAELQKVTALLIRGMQDFCERRLHSTAHASVGKWASLPDSTANADAFH